MAKTTATTGRARAGAQSKRKSAADLVRDGAKRLLDAGVVFAHGTTDPVAEAAFIVGETLGVHPDAFSTIARKPVTAAQAARIEQLLAARIATRKPAAYLLKKIYMRGVPFHVDERAIVPRSYLGEVLEGFFADGNDALMDTGKVRRVLDLCTGSGCLAILAALTFPDAKIDAVDLSAAALALARSNVELHGMAARVALHQGDLYAPLRAARYDLIISNPPYVDAEGMAGLPPECRFEPAMAFDGGRDGLDLVRRILDGAGQRLAPGGGLLCEIGRCRPALEQAYPTTPFLWLDSEESEGEVFWLAAKDLGSDA